MYATESQPGSAGLHAYLFVTGELINACQNRAISFGERLVMAFQALFFFEIWKKFLKTSQYDETKYFISCEAFDITKILVKGIASLALVYHNFQDVPSKQLPLLLWLHSTEPTEHTFGESCHICPDFTFLDFLLLAPKLHCAMLPTTAIQRSAKNKLLDIIIHI